MTTFANAQLNTHDRPSGTHTPVERGSGLLVAGLEGQQPVLDLGKVVEVVGVSTVRWTNPPECRLLIEGGLIGESALGVARPAGDR